MRQGLRKGFDYIIIGGGSAGCVLAHRLSADPDISVLLLEAGGSDWHPLFHMPAGFARMTKGMASWGWHTVPQRNLRNRVFRFTQAKVIGGGSSINAQIYTRGHPDDYNRWAEDYGCHGWDYRAVLPYFKRAEDNQRFVDAFHAYGGPLAVAMPSAPLPICDAFLQAAQEMGIPYNYDFNGRQQQGVGYYQLTQMHQRRASTATAYLASCRMRDNFSLQTGTIVNRVILKGNRAVGIEFYSGNKPNRLEVIYPNREIILAAGAIGSPKILLQSGIGSPQSLQSVGIKPLHPLPGVGENLQDHLDLYTISECSGNHSYDKVAAWYRSIWAGIQYLLFKSGPVASSLFETGGFWFLDTTSKTPDVQFHLGLGSGIEAGVNHLSNVGITLNSAYLSPRSRGTVTLAGSNPTAPPRIDPNYWAESHDRKMAIKGLTLAREIMQQPALRKYITGERLPGKAVITEQQLFKYACNHAKTDHHPVGTCMMGTAERAVVDPELKVHGISNLRVCDSSIMPTIPACNTNAPTIMLAEKGADVILGQPPLAPAQLTD